MYSTRAFAELTGVTVKALRQAPETRDAWSRRARLAGRSAAIRRVLL